MKRKQGYLNNGKLSCKVNDENEDEVSGLIQLGEGVSCPYLRTFLSQILIDLRF